MKFDVRHISLIVVLVIMFGGGTIRASETVPPWEMQSPSPAIRDYLAKVDAADAIADPLQRCLAFPDLPDNHWPIGLAQAECHYIYDPIHVTLDVIEDHLHRGAYASLDAIFAADLKSHFSKKHFSEEIHRDFGAIQADDRSGRLTQLWLDADPDSPFALSARASYLRKMGQKARGSDWASDTPDANMQNMHDFFDKSALLYQKALRIEPRLMPAYVGLIVIGSFDSRQELRAQAFKAAQRIDPACDSIINYEMDARRPRWGGSYEQMQQLEAAITPFLKRRPLLGLYIGSTLADQGEMLCSNKQYAQAELALSKIPPLTTNTTPYHCLAYSMLSQGTHAIPWKNIMYVIAASRFDFDDKDENLTRGKILNMFGRPDMAQKYLQRGNAASQK